MRDHESTDLESAAHLAADEGFPEHGPSPDEYTFPCGCTEYHTADCPRMTDRYGDRPEPDDWDDTWGEAR